MSADITPLIFTLLGTGLALAALMIGLVAWLRTDMRRMEDGLKEDMQRMEGRMENRMVNIEDRLSSLEGRLSALEHSQAKLEGLLDGLREAIVARAAA